MDGEIPLVSCPKAWMKKPLNHQCGRPTNMKRMFEDLCGLRQQHMFEGKQKALVAGDRNYTNYINQHIPQYIG
jgi:hypothetical protein